MRCSHSWYLFIEWNSQKVEINLLCAFSIFNYSSVFLLFNLFMKYLLDCFHFALFCEFFFLNGTSCTMHSLPTTMNTFSVEQEVKQDVFSGSLCLLQYVLLKNKKIKENNHENEENTNITVARYRS